MIIAIKHDVTIRHYESKLDFLFGEFPEFEYKDGRIIIGNWECPHSYGKSYTESEAVKDFVKSNKFREFYESRYWKLYRSERI